MEEESYKTSKEAFVSGATGSTFTHINFVSAAALCSITLYLNVKSHCLLPRKLALFSEWVLLVLPLLLSMTAFASAPLLLCAILLIPNAFILVLAPNRDDPPPLSPVGIPRVPWSNEPSKEITTKAIIPLPALTVYRSHMLLMTFLAILAVDFPMFPRSLAKCETFGVSLMDIGVGSFVFSQGVISAIPLLKDPSRLLGPTPLKLRTVVRKVMPLFILGIVRVISVKGTAYPEHESEYGAHWNFFFTMAILPIMEVVLHPLILRIPISLLGFLVASAHQLTLSVASLQHFALNAPRTDFISANKEGLVSLAGYFAIHLFGLSLGTVLLPSSPSEFRRLLSSLRQHGHVAGADRQPEAAHRQDDKTLTELFSYSILWWICTVLCYMTNLGEGVSRRLANLPYVLWIAAYNTSFIMLYLLLDMMFRPESSQKKNKRSSLHPSTESYFNKPEQNSVPKAPALLEAINHNGLALFLLANVATGLINLSMKTMYASDATAMVVLSLYSFGLCAVAWACRGTKIWRL